MRTWSWMEMVGQLNKDGIEYVVEDGVPGRCLVGCEIKLRRNSYDHSRQVNERNAKKKLAWDFVIYRNDGTAVRLHPEWSSVKVRVYPLDGYAEPLHPLKGVWEDRTGVKAF